MADQVDLHMSGHILFDELDFVSNLTVQIKELLVAAELRYFAYTRLWRIVMSSVA